MLSIGSEYVTGIIPYHSGFEEDVFSGGDMASCAISLTKYIELIKLKLKLKLKEKSPVFRCQYFHVTGF